MAEGDYRRTMGLVVCTIRLLGMVYVELARRATGLNEQATRRWSGICMSEAGAH